MKQFTEKEIQHQMECNHCTREEALDILAWDYDIDHGDKEKGAPTPEQKKLLRTLTKADKDPNKKRVSKPRERKVDSDKAEIFGLLRVLFEGLELNGKAQGLTCKNEAELSFTYKGAGYTVKLTKHRTPKE